MRRVQKGSLQVAELMSNFIEDEVIPGTKIDKEEFWQGFGRYWAGRINYKGIDAPRP